MNEGPLDLLVLVPVHRNAETLPELVRRLRAQPAVQAPGTAVVLVDDASPDHSWSVIEELAAAHDGVGGLLLRPNVGPAAALTAAARTLPAARVVCTIDADLELRPEDLPAVLAPLDQHDLVAGRRAANARRAGRRVASALVRPAIRAITGLPISDPGNGYTAMRGEVLRRATADGPPPALWRPRLWRAAEDPTEVDVGWDPSGPSGFRFGRLVRMLAELVVAERLPDTSLGRRQARRRSAVAVPGVVDRCGVVVEPPAPPRTAEGGPTAAD